MWVLNRIKTIDTHVCVHEASYLNGGRAGKTVSKQVCGYACVVFCAPVAFMVSVKLYQKLLELQLISILLNLRLLYLTGMEKL